jgi:hypothetical protein
MWLRVSGTAEDAWRLSTTVHARTIRALRIPPIDWPISRYAEFRLPAESYAKARF